MIYKTLKWLLGSGVVLFVLAGCAVTQPQKVPHQPLHITDREFNRSYFIYFPSTYGQKPASLVVTCHGTNPWDSARMQIDEWKYLAEKHHLVVIAPVVLSARGFVPPGPSEGVNLLQEDERFILKILRQFQNNSNIDSQAMMITGWSAGGFPAYYIGLRNPDIFRVIVARQSNFIREYYVNDSHRFNPYQPILIFYGNNDVPILRADSQVAYQFLQKADFKNVTLKGLDGGHSRRPEVAVKFFLDAIQKYPHPTILSGILSGSGEYRIQLHAGLSGSVSDAQVFWDLGDGNRIPGKVVDHVYSEPGTYDLAIVHAYGNQTVQFSGQIEVTPERMAIMSGAKR